MWRQLVICTFAVFLLSPGTGLSQTIDPHAVFEERCSRCHTQHAGQFTRKTLTMKADGEIVGRKTDEPIKSFLAGHSGNPSREEISALLDMFAVQIQSGGLFEKKCRICHDSAKKLARVRLEMRNGRLVGWISARDVRDFLTGHGRLDNKEVEIINRMLVWQLQYSQR